MILEKIVERKKSEVKAAKREISFSDMRKKAEGSGNKSMFKAGISRKGKVNLIAEIKKSSPSKGIIRGDFDPPQIAWEYQNSGAGAISVLTDERFFDGKLEYLRVVRDKVNVPLLRKDFIIDQYQVFESAVNGADAILLISRILSKMQLAEYLAMAHEIGMDSLVEIHSHGDLEKALDAGAEIIGVNNRDLDTFQVDIANTKKMVRYIPQNKVIVSESGIENYEEVMFLKGCGVNAVLIGETFMRAQEIGQKVREVMGKES